jgi:hypothetical protein
VRVFLLAKDRWETPTGERKEAVGLGGTMMIRYQEEDPTVNRGSVITTRPIHTRQGAWRRRIRWATTLLLRAPGALDPPSCLLLRCSQSFPSFIIYICLWLCIYTHNAHWACECINLNEIFFVFSLDLEVLTITREIQKKKESKRQK